MNKKIKDCLGIIGCAVLILIGLSIILDTSNQSVEAKIENKDLSDTFVRSNTLVRDLDNGDTAYCILVQEGTRSEYLAMQCKFESDYN